MNNLSKLFLFLILIIAIASSIFGMEFGNIAIFVDKTTIKDINNIFIQIENELNEYSFESNDNIIIWNIHPGVHKLNILDNDGNVLKSISINIFPNLTNKIILSIKDKQFTISDCGFADQAGHIFTFTQDEIRNFPGEMSDGLGSLGETYYQSDPQEPSYLYSKTLEFNQFRTNIQNSKYSYDGLSYTAFTDNFNFVPSYFSIAELAIVNLSDPFGGYNNSTVSLISNFNNPNQFKAESVIGERGRIFYRGAAGYNLPNGIGSIFGSVSIENIADAFPHSNVDGILPNNSMDNSEFTAGAGINISPEIKSDFRMFYRSYKRDIYRHSYYFNQYHAPREEGCLYRGKFSIYGKLPQGFFFDTGHHKKSKELFFEIGIELSGDENKAGDGLYFDDIESYHRDNWPGSGNPAQDNTGLFWSWDDIDSVTSDIDEAHVYNNYNREHSREWKTNIGLTKSLGNSSQLILDVVYSGSTFRKLQYLFPANGDTINMVNIGFDRFGNKIEKDSLTEIPKPNLFEISLGAKHITENYSITGSLDYLRFNSNVLTVIDIHNPFSNDDPTLLEISDLTPAKIKSKIGLRLAADYALYKNFRLFSNFKIKYYPPSNKYLFNNYRFYENRLKAGGYYYALGNPELDFEQNRTMELGISFKENDNFYTLSYKTEKSDNLITSTYITNVDPKSYTMYLNQSTGSWGSSDLLTFSFQRKGNNFFTCSIAASMKDFDFNETKIAGLGSLVPSLIITQPTNALTKLLSYLSFDCSFQYRPGIRYTPLQDGYDPVGLYDVTATPAGPINSGRAKYFLELNAGLTVNAGKFIGGNLIIRGEVINILNRENHLNVYGTTGSPDETGWLVTGPGMAFIENNNQTTDSSGLTGEEKYILASNDPNNFGRPRMFRLIARLEF